MAMWNRQVMTELDAWKEVAMHRARGQHVIDPTQVFAPNGKLIWGYSCSVDVVYSVHTNCSQMEV